MSGLLQAIIPAALAFVTGVATQGLLTRTGRLRSSIRADMELLQALPADHPSRAALEAHIGELVDTLVRRERGRYRPLTVGLSFGVYVSITVFLLLGVTVMALEGTGHYHSTPLTQHEQRRDALVYGIIAIVFAALGYRAWRRKRPTRGPQANRRMDVPRSSDHPAEETGGPGAGGSP